MIFLKAFVVGGLICALGQFILDFFKLTPAHITCGFVVTGAALDVFGLHGAMEKSEQLGFIGIGMGMFDLTAVGITAAILFAFIIALVFKPKG